MTRISFIMPTFNRANYIAESLNIILAQMSSDDELIVVDDGSTDSTREVVAAFGNKLLHLEQENAGKSAALNLAFGRATGEYIWICDDDDLLRPDAVNTLISSIEKSGADMVFGRYTRFRTHGGDMIDMGTGYWPDLSTGSLARHILEDSFVMHNASLVRRNAYEKAGPFDLSMLRSQDYEMFVRLALQSSIVFVDTIIFDQRKHDGARGPSAASHLPAKSDSVWQKFDRHIFEQLHDRVPLTYFTGFFASTKPALSTRAALLQRAAIYARHGLWHHVFTNLQMAVEMAPAGPLQRLEINIIRRAVAGKHGFSGLLKPESLVAVDEVYHSGEFGRDIVGQMARGMIWRLRGGDPQARRDSLRFFRHLGPVKLLTAVMRPKLTANGGQFDGVKEASTPAPAF